VDRPIGDLTAVLDAGPVIVHDPVFGSARYGVVPGSDEV
jgi:hypothetical protein